MTSDTGPRRGRPRALTVDAVVDAATAIVEHSGATALTIRECAQALGVAPNAIYTYFRAKDELLDAVADRLLAAIHLPLDPPAPDMVVDWLAAIGTALRVGLLEHPAAAALLSTRTQQAPSSWDLGERILQQLVQIGIAEEEAVRALYLFAVYVVGSVMLEAAEWPPSGPVPSLADRLAARRQVVEALSPTSFPITSRRSELVANWISDEQFVWGLRRVIDAAIGTRTK